MESLITIATYPFPWQAHIMRGRLQADGFTVMLADEEIVTVDWTYSNAVGGVKLRVPVSEAQEAKTALIESESSQSDEEPTKQYGWRALVIAGLGSMFPPLYVYGVYLLFRYWLESEDDGFASARYARWATILFTPQIAFLCCMVAMYIYLILFH